MVDILVVYMCVEFKFNFNYFLGCLFNGQLLDDRNGVCIQDIDELFESFGIMMQCGVFEELDFMVFQ